MLNIKIEEYENVFENLNKEDYMIIIMSIKNFQMLYYLHGKSVGTEFLQSLHDHGLQLLNENEYIFPLYGDLFLIYLHAKNKLDVMKWIYDMDDMCTALSRQYYQQTLNLSFGIYDMKTNTDFYEAYHGANLACVQSQDYRKYATTFEFYTPQLFEQNKSYYQIESMLEKALSNNEFQVYLQPKVDVLSTHIVGAEALIRWYHQEEEIPLRTFMPVIDENTFIRRIDIFVFEKVCQLLQTWTKNNQTMYPISINISKASFEDGYYYLGEILDIQKLYTFDRKYIEFELSEHILFEKEDRLLIFLERLHKEGYSSSLDDFGSGYASICTLTYLPIQTVKLDASFFQPVMSERQKIIIEHIIHMLKKLQLKIVAEGIETKVQYDMLKTYACDMIQGYYFYKPMPITEFEKLI